ncbi:hypothetical protein Pmani_015211 [Petrolisthes manimaculis]|uniref:RNA-directed DNA polymerase n=1 Tax=Petrolisthes manimaculis TaxID=1843537 RepID=A0AAE1PU62_9EUCA|nr:hypothetical protein Pmani_015211 [Petrolisthes manimaculis]
MASANRPRYATPRGGRPRTPRRPGGPTLNVTGPELTGLLSNMASLATQRTSAGGRLPAGATPNKCEMEMKAAGFRTWRRSIETWLRLAGWSNEEAVLHIRLLCAPDLQCAVDARFDRNQWETMQPREALDAISKLVLQTSNQAVRWSDFFNACQTPGESVNVYINRCAQEAVDCGFQCPGCRENLSEYMLIRKVMVGLHDSVLKQEVFCRCDTFTDIDSLRNFCSSFEAAQRDANRFERERMVAGSDVIYDDAIEEEPLVAASRYQPPAASRNTNRSSATEKLHNKVSKQCYYCGQWHVLDKMACPAYNRKCNACGKKGHLKKVCKSVKTGEEVMISSVEVGAASLLPEPTVIVMVTAKVSSAVQKVDAIADTGAQVCVAGPNLLSVLDLKPAQLLRRAGIRDLAKIPLTSLGAAVCRISVGECSTVQEVYFIKSVERMYLSLTACKELGIVHPDFPKPVPMVAGVAIEGNRGSDIPERPISMPFKPLEENVPRLEEWLLGQFSTTTFNNESYPLRVMEGSPHRIHLMEGARTHTCFTPTSVPKHWGTEVKKQLDEDVKRGVLRQVPAGEANEWCARMVVVAKKSGKPRRTVDFQKLNSCCLRETHHTPAPFDMVSDVPPHSFKTVADAHWGFHQVELDEDSRHLTTFITPWGRYQYCRTPMGHCSATDAYTKRFDDAVTDFPCKHKCVDDTLLYDSSVEGAFWHTYEFLELCAKKGITLKPEKFSFCKREVEFVGFHLGWEEYRPTEDRLAAIRNFTVPAQPTITDIRSWFGFVNQLAPFLAAAPVMTPFRDLLKKPTGSKVYWDEQLRQKLTQAKETICQLAKDGLAYYDRTRPTAAITDWSKEGIGFVVLQQYCLCTSADSPFCCRGGWRLALCGSRHLTTAEAGYAPIEGEALAVAWCLRKARLFQLGCPNLVLVTDHRPLVGLLSNKALTDIVNPRLFRLKEQTLQYQLTMRYLPGKRNCAADFLSRYPSMRTPPDATDEEQGEDLAAAMAAAVVANLDLSDSLTLDEDMVLQASQDDPVYQLLIARVLAGDWHPQKAQEIACLRQYYSVRERLGVSRGLVTYTYDQIHPRLVVPESLCQQVAANLHAGHQGVDSMLRRARQAVYWSGIEGDLRHHRLSCQTCNTHSPSQPPEPLLLMPPPQYPFQQTVVDICQLEGHNYLVYANRLTGWLEISHLDNHATSNAIQDKLRRHFSWWGAPEELSMDGGTNLVSEEMKVFLRKWGVKTRVSSAYYPQSNGRAEAAVKSAKRVLRGNIGADGNLDTDKATLALMQYHNMPLRDINKSPAQLATDNRTKAHGQQVLEANVTSTGTTDGTAT